ENAPMSGPVCSGVQLGDHPREVGHACRFGDAGDPRLRVDQFLVGAAVRTAGDMYGDQALVYPALLTIGQSRERVTPHRAVHVLPVGRRPRLVPVTGR